MRPARRHAFTLIELAVTLAVLLILAALVLPSTTALYGNVRQRAAADALRARMADARARAMDASEPYRVALSDDGTRVRVAPDVAEFAELSSSPTGEDGSPGVRVVEDTFDRATAAVVDGDPTPGGGGWVRVATFLPDGTCREDRVAVEVREEGFPPMIVQLRGLTGTSRVVRPTPAGAAQ